MNALEIRDRLHRKGLSCSLVAEALGLGRPIVSQVIYRRASSYRVARAIAALIDEPVERVFPDVPRYHIAASPRPTPRERELAVSAARETLRAAQ